MPSSGQRADRRVRRGPRVALAAIVAFVLAVGLLDVVGDTTSAEAQVSAADWKAGDIISNGQFFDGNAMTASTVQSFLNSKGSDCTATSVPCMKNYSTSTPATPAESGLCSAMAATSSSTAAQIVDRVGRACGISQQVILVMIQKESSIVTTSSPTESMYKATAGFACPDSTGCDAQYYGFFNQVYRMARQFKVYAQNPTRYGYQAGRNNTILYNPNTACGSSTVYIQNQATANLYIYTPYQPNQAALNNMYGTGDSCSAYGNRNFWRFYNDWFAGETAIDPQGAVDSITPASNGAANVHGWAWDGSSPLGTVMVRITSGGQTLATVPANYPKPELAYYGIPGNHAFAATVYPPKDGANEICATAVNIGGGKDVQIGCKTVTVGYPKINPGGAIQTATGNSGTGYISMEGYAYDMSTPTAPVVVIVTVNGAISAYLYADKPKPELAYYGIPGNHGFTTAVMGTVNGTNTVCAYAVNTLGGVDQQIGCRSVNLKLPGSPQGAVQSATQDSSDTVRVTGYAFDPDNLYANTIVTLTQNGQAFAYMYANQPKPELAYYGVPGNHGFAYAFKPTVSGTLSLCAYSTNLGRGAADLVGCKSLSVVAAGSPQGAVNPLTASGGNLTVSGWAYDPDYPYNASTLMVTVNGQVSAYFYANKPKPELAYYGIPGNHGYSWTFKPPKASGNTVCVYAFNQGPGADRLLGCSSK